MASAAAGAGDALEAAREAATHGSHMDGAMESSALSCEKKARENRIARDIVLFGVVSFAFLVFFGTLTYSSRVEELAYITALAAIPGAILVFGGALEVKGYRRFKACAVAVLAYFGTLLAYIGLFLLIPIPFLVMIIFVAPVVEETLKTSLVKVLGAASWSLGLCVGVGFGVLENISYLVFYSGVEGLYFVRLGSLALHAAASSIAFYGISVGKKWRYLFLAMLLHGLYNAFYPMLVEAFTEVI